MVPWVDLRCVTVVFPGHTHLRFGLRSVIVALLDHTQLPFLKLWHFLAIPGAHNRLIC